MERRIDARVAALVAVLVFGTWAWTSSAQAAPARWAYLLADQPLAASYTPTPQRNSSGATNTVIRSAAGRYRVLLPNLGANAGMVHVTADGNYTQYCKVESWGPIILDPTTQEVRVRCFNMSGELADSRFTLSYADPVVPDNQMAYLWANSPSQASYTPLLNWQFNSTGAANTVTRNAQGVYTATLPNLGSFNGWPIWAGHVQVTAYGTGTEQCKVSHWAPVGSDIQVGVRCFTGPTPTLPGGFPADTRFTLTYAQGNSLIGAATGVTSAVPGPSGEYVWANDPTAASYTPAANYQWDDTSTPGSSITITRLSLGSYVVDLTRHSTNGDGNVQVTAYGTGPEYCHLAGWSGNGIQVHCFDRWGRGVDTRFTLAFLTEVQGL
jgi:hypothetical protein